MSRTLRRKDKNPNRKSWTDLDWFLKDWDKSEDRWTGSVLYEKYTPGYKKGLARYHSDMGTSSCKEPGPSWFRNLTSERPLRRKHKNEIRKAMLDQEYEPNITSKGHLEYWT